MPDFDRYALMPLILIAGLSAVMLAVAWRSFGFVRHALTWGAAFAILAAMWLIRLTMLHMPPAPISLALLLPVMGGCAVTLGTLGFRQRAHLPPRRRQLLTMWAAQMAITLLLLIVSSDAALLPTPFYVQTMTMLFLSARTLTGRRRTERAAERGAELVLALGAAWTGICLGDAVHATGPGAATARMLAETFQPAALMAVSAFAIFLIAADLADRLRRLASTDRLTGLLNRRGFDDMLSALLVSARRHRRQVVVVLIDIDHFKAINDTHGHAAGDEAIRAIGACLTANVARRDLVARPGGEEFAIVMTDLDAQAALCAAEVLRERIAALTFDHGQGITASFGVAPLIPDADSQAELLARADRALYQSKAEGRDRVTLFGSGLTPAAGGA